LSVSLDKGVILLQGGLGVKDLDKIKRLGVKI
jgi:hypothetical protein